VLWLRMCVFFLHFPYGLLGGSETGGSLSLTTKDIQN
jgi:hypothetical protein